MSPRPRRKPRVAVLMSTWNGARWLPAQLDSLAAQAEVEVLLHARDDGSTDETLAVLARYARRWPALTRVPSGPNLGPAMSFLELLRTAPAGADYYAFCDQDDVWRPGKLARAVAHLAAEPGPALYGSNVTCVAEDLTPLGVPRENADARFQHLLFENIVYGCTAVMNRAARELIAARPPERGVIMHDWWCALVAAALGRVIYDPEPGMILYRQHGGNSVGMDANLMTQTMDQASRFLRTPRGYYRIHAQAEEILRLYGRDLPAETRARAEELVGSKRTLAARARLAFSGRIVRSHLIGDVIARGLVLAGWY